jgi:hypothetical protein
MSTTRRWFLGLFGAAAAAPALAAVAETTPATLYGRGPALNALPRLRAQNYIDVQEIRVDNIDLRKWMDSMGYDE